MATICDTKGCGKPAKRYAIFVAHVESSGDQIKGVWDIDADLCADHLKRLGEAINAIIPPEPNKEGKA
jgi:hypothetical protein